MPIRSLSTNSIVVHQDDPSMNYVYAAPERVRFVFGRIVGYPAGRPFWIERQHYGPNHADKVILYNLTDRFVAVVRKPVGIQVEIAHALIDKLGAYIRHPDAIWDIKPSIRQGYYWITAVYPAELDLVNISLEDRLVQLARLRAEDRIDMVSDPPPPPPPDPTIYTMPTGSWVTTDNTQTGTSYYYREVRYP